MHNTIVANNFYYYNVRADLGRDASGSFSVGTSSYNMIGVVGNSGLSASQNNIILGSNGDPRLAPLSNYGGKTRTHALLFDSLAIDAGDDSKASAIGLLYDQRGDPFIRVVDRKAPTEQGFDIDIGAFEVAIGELFT
jgi:hypothetical protein